MPHRLSVSLAIGRLAATRLCSNICETRPYMPHPLSARPVHTSSFKCEICGRSFSSDEALQQHQRASPVHALSFECKTCDRSFSSDEALQQHLRDSKAHQETPNTPLDAFFHSFPTFVYDSSLPPATSYNHLQKHQGWIRGQSDSKEAWDRYQDALEEELRLWFSAEDDLIAWHTLCRAIGIEPPPRTCIECEKVGVRPSLRVMKLKSAILNSDCRLLQRDRQDLP